MHIAPRILRRLRLQDRINYRRHERVGATSFVVPTVGGVSYAHSEEWMTALIERLFDTVAGAFVDVGVNLGQTLLKVKGLDPAREYVGFEPNPACVAYVEQLIAANGLTATTLVPVGVAEQSGLLKLNLYHGDTDSAASLLAEFRPDEPPRGAKVVPVFGYADFAPLLPDRTGILKIDVEGFEQEVLAALRPLLERDRPIVLIEILPAYRADNAFRLERQATIERLLGHLDYRLFRIRHPASGFAGLDPITSIGVHGDLDLSDYLFCPSERAAELAPLR